MYSPVLIKPLPSPEQNFIERTQQARQMCGPIVQGKPQLWVHSGNLDFGPPQFLPGLEHRMDSRAIQTQLHRPGINPVKPQVCCRMGRACCRPTTPPITVCRAHWSLCKLMLSSSTPAPQIPQQYRSGPLKTTCLVESPTYPLLSHNALSNHQPCAYRARTEPCLGEPCMQDVGEKATHSCQCHRKLNPLST